MADMTAKPNGRNLLVETTEVQEEARSDDSGFAGFSIPEEFLKTRHKMKPFEVFKVVDVGPDVKGKYKPGQLILIETCMLDVVDSPVGIVKFISENYVPVSFE